MTEKDNLFLKRIGFLANDNSYFGELVGIAKDFASQNLCVLVVSQDPVLRTVFLETVALFRFKTLKSFVDFNVKQSGSDKLISVISTLDSDSVFFLDNIDCLSLDFQDELLGLIEKGFFEERKILLAAGTDKNLDELAEEGKFSAKLAFRLGLLKTNILSINEIKSGVKSLTWVLLDMANAVSGKQVEGFTKSALDKIENHFWKNGIFELKSVVDFAVASCETETIPESNLPFVNSVSKDTNSVVFQTLGDDKTMKTALDSFKRYYVIKILEENGNNQTQAAKVLGLQRTYVSRLLNELHIR